VLTK